MIRRCPGWVIWEFTICLECWERFELEKREKKKTEWFSARVFSVAFGSQDIRSLAPMSPSRD